MNIYFVNGNNKIKGPFDILDSSSQKIMKIGDVVIREYQNAYHFLFIVSSINKWNACKCVGKSTETYSIEGNMLLFSFDGMSKRVGNIPIINQLKDLFPEVIILDFFQNALDILNYRCDLWDMSIFFRINTLVPIGVESQKTESVQKTAHAYITLFEIYLPEKADLMFKQMHSQGVDLRTIYSKIREEYPHEFRQSMKRFLIDHPNSSIYD